MNAKMFAWRQFEEDYLTGLKLITGLGTEVRLAIQRPIKAVSGRSRIVEKQVFVAVPNVSNGHNRDGKASIRSNTARKIIKK